MKLSKLLNRMLFVCCAMAIPAVAQVYIVRLPAIADSDLGDQVNRALATCDAGCVVNIDAGTYRFSTPILINRPGLKLLGAGGRATPLIFAGTSGAAIEMRMNPFTIDTHDAIQGMSIELENDNTAALLTGDITSATYRDLWINCNGHSNTKGFSVYLLNGWFERNLIDSVDIKYCSNDLSLEVDRNAQFNSFGYNKFLQVGLNVGDGGTGVLIGQDVMLYHSILNLNVNMDTGNQNAFMRVWGTSHANTYQLVGEAASPTIGLSVESGGNWEDGLLSRGGFVDLDYMTNYGFDNPSASPRLHLNAIDQRAKVRPRKPASQLR